MDLVTTQLEARQQATGDNRHGQVTGATLQTIQSLMSPIKQTSYSMNRRQKSDDALSGMNQLANSATYIKETGCCVFDLNSVIVPQWRWSQFHCMNK
jgi:hypothetical protein